MPPKDPEASLPLTALWYSILLALADTPRHGYGMIKEIETRSFHCETCNTFVRSEDADVSINDE